MTDIKLYVACHKSCTLPEHPCIYPVQAGTALAEQTFANMQYDNKGESISELNRSYCELTVQYWAWKNQKADYYGFLHYRRFLAFCEKKKTLCKIFFQHDADILNENGYEPQALQQFVSAYDVLVPCAEHTAETVYQKYVNAPHHYAEDIDLMMALITQYQPEYRDAMEQYLHGHQQYYYNMYVMQRDWFNQYCRWLFPLLECFDSVNNWDKYGTDRAALRVDGYLAERLFGVWYTYQLHNTEIRSIELPWMYFAMENKKDYCIQWLKNKVLPQGSKRKNILKVIGQGNGK